MRFLGFLVVAAALAVPPFVLPAHRTSELATAGAYFVAIVGLDVLARESRRVSLGQSAFMAIGAYTTAILVAHRGTGEALAVALAAVVAGCAGIAVSLVGARALAPVTLALALALPGILARLEGADGIAFAKVPQPYAVTWTVAGALFLVAWAFVASPAGRSLRAVRDSELAAVASGLNRSVWRALAVAFSAAYAGVAGALLALAAGHVGPETFPFALSLTLLAGAAVGLLGSIWGALAGALLVELLSAGLRPGPAAFVLGAVLVAAVLAGRSVRRL